MRKYRLLILIAACFAVMVAEGCGTSTYDDRYEERADDLRYTE